MLRTRRLRSTEKIRNLVSETTLSPSNFIYPIFIVEGENKKESISSMPNVYRYSIDKLHEIIEEVEKLKIGGVILFGIPKEKDVLATGAYNENGIVQQGIRKIKEISPKTLVVTDVCLCEYTANGHCGLTKGEEILNDETLPLLAKTALSHAKAGADMVAPSDMMDGRIEVLREILDENGFVNLPIMSYSAKYSSAYYSPFRDAAESAPSFGDRRTYQMDYRNGKEALIEAEIDITEGADILMVKPALSYLDVVKDLSTNFNVPIATYNVSGEYSMVKAAAEKGVIDEKAVVKENLTAMKRAGASIIITYHALDMAKWLEEDNK